MNLENLIELMESLSTTRRFSQSRLNNEESVLEHIGFVALVSKLLAEHINSISPNLQLDIGEVCSKALLHDVEEARMGDIARPVKYDNPQVRQYLQSVEDSKMYEILQGLEYKFTCDDKLYGEWATAKLGREGAIVKMVDFLAVVYKIHSEVIMNGNRTMVQHAQYVLTQLDEVETHMMEEFYEDDTVQDFLRGVFRYMREVCREASE